MGKSAELEVVRAYGEIEANFENHINDSNNKNIFFSGKYGLGKSTFLRHFFETRSEKFYPVYISPVHYVVSSNEDIFELIKVDIIKQLHADKHLRVDLPDLKGKKFFTVLNYVTKNPIQIVSKISAALAKLHPAAEVVEAGSKAVHELIQDFDKFEKKFNKDVLQADDSKLTQHVREIQYKRGSYLEFDLISRILSEAVARVQSEEGSGKMAVLVIDDLDRMDPEHIFRILNIFSAHHSTLNSSHKFGFSHVIVVADINNIRNIYHHKYGANTEFNGYIDKFYSTEHFEFSSKALILNYIKNHLNIEESQHFKSVLCDILAHLVLIEKVKMRDIVKHKGLSGYRNAVIVHQDFPHVNNIPPFIDGSLKRLEIMSEEVDILRLFWYLTKFLGSVALLEIALNKIHNEGYAVGEAIADDVLKMLAIGDLCFSGVNNASKRNRLYANYVDGAQQYRIGNILNVKLKNQIIQLGLCWTGVNLYDPSKLYFTDINIRHECASTDIREILQNELWSQFQKCKAMGLLNRAGVVSAPVN